MTKRKKKRKQKINWKMYGVEFLSVFIAVISAFALNNWNENRRDRNAEINILGEISNGLKKDIEDIKHNMGGHVVGIRACSYWRDIITNQEFNKDSLELKYQGLTRDFISIQNTSGYESLKSKGLEIIQNDSLRFEIISLYEFNFKILLKLEEEYIEMQFQQSYYNRINDIISPYLIFDSTGQITDIGRPLILSQSEQNRMMSYLRKIEINRLFMLENYSGVEDKITKIIKMIDDEID